MGTTNRKRILKASFLAAGLALSCAPAAFALVISGTDSASNLAAAFTSPASGITIQSSSINYSASMTSGQFMTGLYSDGPLGINGGMILTTGRAIAALPPNGSNISNIMGLAGNALVNTIIGSSEPSYDTIVLTIVFSVESWVNSVMFDFVFGSEEYPDYVGQYNDAFGAFLNGTAASNQIVYDAGGAPVMINGPFFSSGNVKLPPANGTAYNGTTDKLTTRAAITPGSTNNVLRLVIGDVRDAALDSGVFLASFRGSADIVQTPVTGL
ncbi:MAG TPA: choice-of-anchor L domain-containing protein, partial [Candidatus Goldiibacteriota bacterium]|nr:choice-of-anchor L domain-containing protein [Candidatus Goldiibacteriota bacterium]